VVELCADDEQHTPLADGAVFEIARRPQGESTIFAPIWFGGVRGGGVVEDFQMTFTDMDGVVLGSRRSLRFLLPCEDDGTVAAHHLEVFFDRAAPVESYDGVEGVLTVRVLLPNGRSLEDSVEATLVHVPE
jgi:hypothetical protein